MLAHRSHRLEVLDIAWTSWTLPQTSDASGEVGERPVGHDIRTAKKSRHCQVRPAVVNADHESVSPDARLPAGHAPSASQLSCLLTSSTRSFQSATRKTHQFLMKSAFTCLQNVRLPAPLLQPPFALSAFTDCDCGGGPPSGCAMGILPRSKVLVVGACVGVCDHGGQNERTVSIRGGPQLEELLL